MHEVRVNVCALKPNEPQKSSVRAPSCALKQPRYLTEPEYEAMMVKLQEAGDWMEAQLRSRAKNPDDPSSQNG